MAQISQDIWKEILSNQKFPLIGTTEPNNGNGFHDAYSWKQNFFLHRRNQDDAFYNSTFYTIYLRDLGLFINPSIGKKEKFEEGLSVINCSHDYYTTFLKYFLHDHNHFRHGFLRELGAWGELLSKEGRLIFEIIGWYDNNSKQFYAYELNRLNSESCKIGRKYITYKAPHSDEEGKVKVKKVKIPKKKCITIDFPKELGGYPNFIKKIKQIKALGDNFSAFNVDKPKESMEHMKTWDKKFNKIVSEWGASNKSEEVTEFYHILSALKFTNTSVLCLNEIILGLQQLIEYLNEKLGEEAEVQFNIEQYQRGYYKNKINEWKNGNLTFDEVYKILRP